MNEFNLSDKSLECGYCMHGCDEPHDCEKNLMFYKSDVKQFIKELKLVRFPINNEDIDKLAGEKLI